jgi:hypothetical protein
MIPEPTADEEAGMDEFPEGIILDVTPGSAVFEADFLERLGHPVLVCHGPMHDVCPLLEDQSCEMLDSAHGIVFQLDLDRPDHRKILERYRRVLAADHPIRVVVQPGQDRAYAALLEGCQVWTHQPNAGELDGFAAQVEASDLLEE